MGRKKIKKGVHLTGVASRLGGRSRLEIYDYSDESQIQIGDRDFFLYKRDSLKKGMAELQIQGLNLITASQLVDLMASGSKDELLEVGVVVAENVFLTGKEVLVSSGDGLSYDQKLCPYDETEKIRALVAEMRERAEEDPSKARKTGVLLYTREFPLQRGSITWNLSAAESTEIKFPIPKNKDTMLFPVKSMENERFMQFLFGENLQAYVKYLKSRRVKYIYTSNSSAPLEKGVLRSFPIRISSPHTLQYPRSGIEANICLIDSGDAQAYPVVGASLLHQGPLEIGNQ